MSGHIWNDMVDEDVRNTPPLVFDPVDMCQGPAGDGTVCKKPCKKPLLQLLKAPLPGDPRIGVLIHSRLL